MEELSNLGQNCLLKKAIGCLPCYSTAPILEPEASVSTMKGLVKSGSANTGELVTAVFKFWKATVASGVHANPSLVRSHESGAAKVA